MKLKEANWVINGNAKPGKAIGTIKIHKQGYAPRLITLCCGFKSPDEWATTKQACRDELIAYLLFFPQQYILRSTPSVEHCFTKIDFYTIYYIYNN